MIHPELYAAKESLSARFLAVTNPGFSAFAASATTNPHANIMGIGIGKKRIADDDRADHAIKIYVRKKFTLDAIPPGDVLPRAIDGVPVDVEEVGLILPHLAPSADPAKNPKARYRPVQPGLSIGFASADKMAGTLGVLVTDASGATYILSNNHVLAGENTLAPGTPIMQPGLLDGGDPARDRVAELTRFVPLKADADNPVDAAIAKIALDPAQIDPTILRVGKPTGVTEPAVDMIVHKYGRTSDYTLGRISDLDADFKVQYQTGTYLLKSQLLVKSYAEGGGSPTQAFSDAGDSGSLIVERATGKAVALLCAGSPAVTLANRFSSVLSALGVALVL
jgi:hypothetical protein